jgi:dihydroneopterin aldolase
MPDRFVIERFEFEGFVGITESERSTLQPLALDLDLMFDMTQAYDTDNIKNTVNYATVLTTVAVAAKQNQFSLIETLAERLAQIILAEYPVHGLDLWVRKLRPPINELVGSVGARISRVATDHHHHGGPTPWLTTNRSLLPIGRALDLACGRGRNSMYLAKEGFHVEAWDKDQDSLDALAAHAAQLGISTIATRLVDLEQKPDLPANAFDVIVVCYYLQRNIIPAIKNAVKPGGVVVYETFLIDNHTRFDHPRRAEFCLQHNELLNLFSGLRILAYREGAVDPERGPFTASIIATRSA